MSIVMIDSQIMPEKFPVAATARLDREFTSWNGKHWWRQIAGKIRLAIVWRIPVGFEDETGFHLGVQQVRTDESMDRERARLFSDDRHF